MNVKVFLVILAIALFSLFVYIFTNSRSNSINLNTNTRGSQPSTNNLPFITINGVEIPVEIADTEAKQRKGLSGRQKESFPDERGMLFIFNSKTYTPFWMLDMKFPIDIIWISDGEIIDIDANAPAPEPGTRPAEYHPSAPTNFVLEVNAGFSERNSIKVGDFVDMSQINALK